MEENLLCIHVITESSPADLKNAVVDMDVITKRKIAVQEALAGQELIIPEATAEKDAGYLKYAVKLIGPTFKEAQDILLQNQLLFLTKYGAGLEELNMLPFVEKVETDGDTEYYASIPEVFTPDEANQLWSPGIISNAIVSFNEWMLSRDAFRETPANRQCDMLRRCVHQAKHFVVENETAPEGKKLPSQPKKVGSKLYEKRAIRELACDTAAQMIIAAALGDQDIPTQISLAKSITEQGIWKQAPKTLATRFGDEGVIRSLLEKAAKRPKNKKTKAYEEWKQTMENRADMLREAIIHRHDEGFSKKERFQRTDADTGESLPIPTKRKARKNKKKENGEKENRREK